MARIRSVHPGLFTDSDFMELTVAAPLAVAVLIGLWTEADDNGVFEWKPVTLKARIIPAATVPIDPLLHALQRHRFIRDYEVEGRHLGAIRNFKKWQRPQKPKSTHPVTPEIANYVGADSASTVLDDAADQPGTVIPPQRKEEGGKMEEEGGTSSLRSDDGGEPPDDIPRAVEDWNELANEIGLPSVQRLTAGRKAKLRARLKDAGGIEGWRAALAKLKAAPWMHGQNERGWKAGFDFMLQESSFTKLMEGAYDRGSGAGGAKHSNGFAAVLAEGRGRDPDRESLL